MATQSEILELFSQTSAIKNSDQILIITANNNGTVSAGKITAELLRQYLNADFSLTIDADGYICIGGVRTNSQVEGITPLLQRGADGIYVSTDNGDTWSVVAYFTDFGGDKIVAHTTTTATITPNDLHVWGDVSSLTITFSQGTANVVNEYKLEFTVDSDNFTLSLPNGIRWSEDPEWENGYTYQVSIVNNLAIYAGWEGVSNE